MTSSLNSTPTPVMRSSGASLQLHRGEMIAVAVVGIVLGIIALLWQDVTVAIVGVIFGAYLLVSGFVRFASAIVSRHVSLGHRFFVGFMGLIVFAAGVLCLVDPTQSIVLLAFVIGLGWLASGIVDLVGAIAGSVFPRWVGFVSGLFFILAGLVALLMSILAMPRKGTTAAW
jgi:uncharacterized membrane protein HdeD (DUF308 family)